MSSCDYCSDEELTKLANEWTILGKDLISEVTCKEPYEWKDLTDEEWEFSKAAQAQASEKPFHVKHCYSILRPIENAYIKSLGFAENI